MIRRPKLYFSLRSPYSWLTVKRLRGELPGGIDQVDCVPYWDPDELTTTRLAERGGEFHYVQMSRAKHLYMLMDTKRIAERHGLTMSWPIDVDPWWEVPHLAWLVAREQGRAWEFYDAITDARWGRGENICDPDVVRAAAALAGVDPARAVGAVADPVVRDEGVSCLYQAYLDDVFGIPYLKWRRHRFWGLDRVDAFLEVWAPENGATDASEAADRVRTPAHRAAYDTDCAGGCG